MPRKRVAEFPGTEKKKQQQKQKPRTPHPAFTLRPKRRHVGGDLPKNRDLSRFIKYPRYIQVQRKKRILLDRLKVPPVVNQFSFTLEKSVRTELFKLLEKYKPETRVEKRKRLKELAAQKVEKVEKVENKKQTKPVKVKKPHVIKYGVNHVTALVESNAAKIVVIAHDVDPLELVLWLPALCRTKHVPYVIVKGRAQLGALVGKKSASVLALTSVNEGDNADLAKLSTYANQHFNESWSHVRTQWGGKKLGNKTMEKRRVQEKANN